MALNLGPEAYEAIVRLKGNAEWRAFVQALNAQWAHFIHLAIDMPPENRVDATGYARGLRDLAAHIQMVEDPASGRPPKPPVKATREQAQTARELARV